MVPIAILMPARKRSIVTKTLGLPVGLSVHDVNIKDRVGAPGGQTEMS